MLHGTSWLPPVPNLRHTPLHPHTGKQRNPVRSIMPSVDGPEPRKASRVRLVVRPPACPKTSTWFASAPALAAPEAASGRRATTEMPGIAPGTGCPGPQVVPRAPGHISRPEIVVSVMRFPEYPLLGHGQFRAIATAGRAAPWKIVSGCRMTRGRRCKARKAWM